MLAKNAMVAIVGAVDRKQAEKIAEDITSGLEQGEKAKALDKCKKSGKGQ